MKWLIRGFFRTVRRVLGPVMLAVEWLTRPKGVQRPAEEQQRLDELTQHFSLYQFRTCPFCMKVRHEIRRQSLNIQQHDAQFDEQNRQRLHSEGGRIQVPCLHVRQPDGSSLWIYESSEIIAYLQQLDSLTPVPA